MAETGGRYYPSAQSDKIEVMQAASVTELLSEMPGHVTLIGNHTFARPLLYTRQATQPFEAPFERLSAAETFKPPRRAAFF
jgi:hypothetical protein